MIEIYLKQLKKTQKDPKLSKMSVIVIKNDKKWHKRDLRYVLKLMWYFNINYSTIKMLKNAKKVKCDRRTDRPTDQPADWKSE